MAWVSQSFGHAGFKVELLEKSVSLGDYTIWLMPMSAEDAHSWAMMLRRAARRLEEIGKGLPNG